MITRDRQQYKIQETGPMSWEELKKVFPAYFETGKNHKPVSLQFDERLKRMGFTQDFKTQVPQWPASRNISRSSKVMIDGIESDFAFITRPVQDGNLGNFKSQADELAFVSVQRGGDPTQGNKEMLWYMWFCSNDILNNVNSIKSPGARLLFSFPEKEALAKNTSRLMLSKLSASILDTEVLSYESIVDIAHSVGRTVEGLSDAELRDELIVTATVNEAFAKDLAEAIKRVGKDDVSFEVKKAIGIAKEAKGIKLDKRTGWFYTTGEEDVLIVKTNNSEDYDEQLARYLVKDKEAQDKFLSTFK